MRADGSFSLCLLPGRYGTSLTGGTLSIGVDVTLPSTATFELQGHPAALIKSPPQAHDRVAHGIEGLVADIERSKARLVGMGEATHGTGEFATMRAQLTLELARRSRLRMVLLENDAIACSALDDYVNGKDVDLPKAVAALGFWVTDTHEFLRALQDIRVYNLAQASSADRIRIWGIDPQDTEPPTALLVANQARLNLTSKDIALLQEITPHRAKAVKLFTADRRAALDALLLRLATPMGPTDADTQIAVAARSLAVQVGYMDGDTQAMYSERRDLGMAQLAHFLIERTGVPLASVWAHDGHITRGLEGGRRMGYRLSAMLPNKYYPVGFYMFEGASRAWDPGTKIGVIPHRVKAAPPYTVEGAIMAATGAPDVAWVPFATLPKTLRTWLDLPRFARQMGAGYLGEDRSMILCDIGTGFDAVVVIRTAHESTPTPTGIRRAKT